VDWSSWWGLEALKRVRGVHNAHRLFVSGAFPLG
jgi:hypothetical protein